MSARPCRKMRRPGSIRHTARASEGYEERMGVVYVGDSGVGDHFGDHFGISG
jgi:hypothetical protein